MSVRAYERSWADVLADHAARDCSTDRLVRQLAACEAAALAFCLAHGEAKVLVESLGTGRACWPRSSTRCGRPASRRARS
jgi:hypothetical protein